MWFLIAQIKRCGTLNVTQKNCSPLTEVWPGKAQPACGRNQVVVRIAQYTLEISSNRGTGYKKKLVTIWFHSRAPKFKQINLNI